jgi:nucleotide-binding universal stress UspA family protein
MYRNILVPLDGSGLSECVFQHVKEIAKGNQVSDIELLYVVPPLNTYLQALTETTDKRISLLSVPREP